MPDEFQDLWQCHECHRILDPDTTGSYRDYPDSSGAYIDLIKCGHCGSIDVDDFTPQDLIDEMKRLFTAKSGLESHNLDHIQIILEGVFDL